MMANPPRKFGFAVVCATLCLGAATMVSGSTTALVVSGGPDEPITHGISHVYTPADGTFSFYQLGDNGVRIVFQGPEIQINWEVDIAAPQGTVLAPGTYDSPADVRVSGFLIGCSYATGSFVVHELVRELDGGIVAFHASFRQVCGDTDANALTGDIFYNSNDPLPPPTRITNSVYSVFLTKGQPFKYQLTSSANLPVYSATNLPPGLTVTFNTGLISGTPTAEGDFSVGITVVDANNNTSGSATLQFTVDPASRSRGPYSAISVIGDPGNYVSSSLDAFIGPANAVIHGGITDINYSGASVSGGGWGVSFSTGGQPFAPGIYKATFPELPGQPGLGVSGPRGGFSYGSTGQFEILSFDHGPNGELMNFRANFEYHYDNEVPAVRGTVWYGVENAITSRGQVRVNAGTPFTYQIIANNAPTAFAAENLPPGLTVDGQTGMVSGTPTKAGRYMVTLSALNGDVVARDTVSFYIVPAGPPPPAPPPIMNLSVNTTQVHEGGVARVTLTSSGPSAFNLTPRIQITRKKASPADFTLTPPNLMIPAGQTSASMDLHAVVDSLTEKAESVTLKLVKGPGYKAGPNSKVTVNLLDGPNQ